MPWYIVYLNNKQRWLLWFLRRKRAIWNSALLSGQWLSNWKTHWNRSKWRLRPFPPMPTPQHQLSSPCNMSWCLSWALLAYHTNQQSKKWGIWVLFSLLNIKTTIIAITKLHYKKQLIVNFQTECDTGLNVFIIIIFIGRMLANLKMHNGEENREWMLLNKAAFLDPQFSRLVHFSSEQRNQWELIIWDEKKWER